MIARLIAEKSGTRARRARALPRQQTLVAIGASAGGPKALATLLRELPKDFPGSYRHRPTCRGSVRGRHGRLVEPAVGRAGRGGREGDWPEVGRVLLAGTSDHLALKRADRLGYTPDPRDYAYRPSIDVFFDSVSRLWRGDAVGVLLTGMGRDGALGLKALRDGAITRSHRTGEQRRVRHAESRGGAQRGGRYSANGAHRAETDGGADVQGMKPPGERERTECAEAPGTVEIP